MTPEIENLIRETVPVALGVLLRRGERFADAEDAVQEASILAADAWSKGTTPQRPVGWVVRVAQRRLIDRHRADTARQRRESLVASWSAIPAEPTVSEDDSLALLFLCCHSALTPNAAIPLTLRAVGGLTTHEIADALLISETTVAQRISRAKAAITRSGEPFRRPPPDLIDARLPAVMQVIYLIFTEGHAATNGPRLQRTDLADEAIRLARRLHERLSDHPETAGLLALLLLTAARRPARSTADNELIPLDAQDRTRWDRPMITEGLILLTGALGQHAMGEYQIQAAIAAVHDQAPTYETTDWARLRSLYDLLAKRGDNPLVRLNRAVAVAHTQGPELALREVAMLSETLNTHHRYHATLAYLHDLAGERALARKSYATAAELATNEPERRYLQRKSAS